ncbi:unnamed protein product [Microthlaspi erraticum]|uniref:Uncharacterized protein n=1 Tax=Microthlaspi erraticum TaxID=1685480 RepID=A0A6D2JEI1_9BRAS|nr:unnamed protein product [Microthlaspi erraticum]
MDSVFRSATEKLEREHRESKESGIVELERQRKADDAATRQREAVEASQRARRLQEALEAPMRVEDNLGEGTEHRGEMREEAKVDRLSDEDAQRLVAYYIDLMQQQDVAEDGAPVAGGEEEEEEVCYQED